MIIITNEMLDKAFGELRVHGTELYSWSVEELSKRDAYGKDIRYLSTYDKCSDPQKYVDNWMNSTIAKTEVAEYYKNLSFKGEDNMNKYETLLKKYEALYKDFEAYKQVTEDIADKGTYVRNEALAELLECKKKYEVLKEEQDAYCTSAEVVGAKLIETEKKYKRLMNERDGFEKENIALIKERDDLVKEVYYLHEVINEKNSKCKEKMEKLKQRDKQITKLIDEKNALHTLYTETAKERDDFEKRLEHVNAMSNLEWEFEVVEEGVTKPTTLYDELVSFCENRRDGGKDCFGCPNEIACDGINPNFRPAKWTENQKEDYNELMDVAEYCNKAMNNKEDK